MNPNNDIPMEREESPAFNFTTLDDQGAITEDGTDSDMGSAPSESYKSWDFRSGNLPLGVEIVGEYSFVLQRDGSSALLLPPSSYINIHSDATGACLDAYSILLDVLVDSLPKDSFAILHTNASPNPTDGEALLYASGGIGVFGEVGVADATMQPQKWTRVGITYGNAATPHDSTRRMERLERMDLVESMRMRREPIDSARHLITYINGRKCADISSHTRGVLAVSGGRFSLSTQLVTLFQHHTSSVLIKYVEMRPQALSADAIKELNQHNRVYSTYEIEQEKRRKELQTQLTLSGLYKQPMTLYQHPVMIAEFCDSYLENTGLEGGAISTSLTALAFLYLQFTQHVSCLPVPASSNIDRLLSEFAFAHDELQAFNYISGVLGRARDLMRKYELAKQNGAPQLVFFMKTFLAQLHALQVGETMMSPGGVNSVEMVYVIERHDVDAYRFTLINTSPDAGLEYHLSQVTGSPDIQYQTSLILPDVRGVKIMDEAFWALVFKLSVLTNKHNTCEKLYNLLIPFLSDKPYDQVLLESEQQEPEWRLPQKSNTSYVKCVMEAIRYLLRSKQVSVDRCNVAAFSLRSYLLAQMRHDIGFVANIASSEVTVVQMICSELALQAASLGEHNSITESQLLAVHDVIEDTMATIHLIPCDKELRQPVVSMDNIDGVATLHPFFDRFRRLDDVDGLAGAPIVLPKYVPIDFTLIPKSIRSLDDAIAAIRYCDRLCTLISVQHYCVKNTALLKVSLIENVFMRVLPIPKAKTAMDFNNCIWSHTPVTYSIQIDLSICLGRILEHFISAAFSLHSTKSLDALKLLISAAIASILDVLLRKVSVDQPSEFCMRYMGRMYGGVGDGYCLSMDHFAKQSQTLELHTPELALARTALLDYFLSQKYTSCKSIFNWHEGNTLEPSVAEFLGSLCNDVAYPTDPKSLIGYLIKGNHLINKNYPEFHILRDVAYYMKFVQNTDPRAFPPKHGYSQMDAELAWDFNQGVFIVQAFLPNFSVRCYPETPYTIDSLRYPSSANPTLLASPHNIATEDDVLHVKHLPSFDGALGQADSELLLSYLTVPYMRIPLVLSFFSSEDRIHALRSEHLQAVFDAVLFEPDAYLDIRATDIPTHVPCPDRNLLATSHGLLLNELAHSPDMILNCLLKLLALSVDLDVGTVHSATAIIVQYIIRVATRVESSIVFLLDIAQGKHECISTMLRSITLSQNHIDILSTGLAKMRSILRVKLHSMLENWCAELIHEAETQHDDAIVDRNARLSCQIHAHLVLVYRNASIEEYNLKIVATLLSSFLYLTTRHTWNMNLLSVPEHEIFESLAVQRRSLINWLRSQQQRPLGELLETAVRVTAGTGSRRETTALQMQQIWAFISGDRSCGRFTVSSSRRVGVLSTTDDIIATIDDATEHGVEIDVQIAQLTLKSSHLSALHTDIANDLDVQAVFGRKSMQAAVIESTEHREWVNLIGRGHSIQYWKTPDDRPCIQEFDRDYSPGELEPSEEWIVPLFEPVRLTYMTKPFVLQVCLPETPLPRDADVACLVGIHPKMGGTWKEIFVYRSLGMVCVYNVTSHGRRFYRVLEYTSNVQLTLREMQPSLDDRQALWPSWERHGAGHPYADHWGNPLSCIISRGWDYEENLSGGIEVYIPDRLLYGLVPQALLDAYMFWQDEDDNLRGYARDKNSPYIIYITLEPVDDYIHTTSARIQRLLKAPAAERLRKQASLLQQLIESSFFDVAELKVSVAITKRLGQIVDRNCETLGEFLEALQLSGAKYDDIMLLIDEIEQHVMDESCDMEVTTSTELPLDQRPLVLLDAVASATHSKLRSALLTLCRLENASNILFWSSIGATTIDLIELPRLKLNFHEKNDDHGVPRIYSLDHSNIFVSNFASPLTEELMQGMPHSLLMSSADNELQILVPIVDLVRPRIGSSPFSTELVLNRSDVEWSASLDTCYFLYPIHVSLSFLFTPTLSSSLYLLLMRFLNRRYHDVFRLVATIGTDTDFSKEENHIFQTLARSASDYHPDAHACRLKISVVTADAPVVCPWNLTREASRYVMKLNTVSQVCRLSLEEELQVLDRCVCDDSDPRFYHPETGAPLYTLYEVTIVKNRKYFLSSLLGNKSTADVFMVPRPVGSRWPVHRNLASLMLDESSFASLEIYYAAPVQVSGHAVLELAHRFWNKGENSLGMGCKLGFLFLYELLTGTKRAHVLQQDVSRTLATLLFELMSDKDEESLLPSIISLLCRFPHLAMRMPKFNDDRHLKTAQINAYPDDSNPVSPLGRLLTEILEILQTEITNIMMDYDEYRGHPSTSPSSCDVPTVRDMNWMLPHISDYSCSKRAFSDILTSDMIPEELSLGYSDIENFASLPLAAINIATYTLDISRSDAQLPLISDSFPFDVSKHPYAQTTVATSMLTRLQRDVREYADMTNQTAIQRCTFLADVYGKNGDIALSRAGLTGLIKELEKLRESDASYVQSALPWLRKTINDVGYLENKSRLVYVLRRFAKVESTIWLEFLFASALSSRQYVDLTRLNPYLSRETIDVATNLLIATILHANRISHINRCIQSARDLDDTLEAMQSSGHDLHAALLQKEELLSRNLTMRRHYVDCESHVSGEGKRQKMNMTYDPRFLLFEFTWSILLRKSQVTIVRDYAAALERGESTVKQMIMGQGKTTVVCPLLTLMMGNGSNLIVQVVPPALLELSRAVMRSTFSSIMHKRIYTLNFDRSYDITPTIYKKLVHSAATGGVVIATPTTVKSIMLKFIELLYMLNDPTCPRTYAMETDCHELGRVLRLFKDGILIMDEVDLILHPLKSELNFPIGARQDLDCSPQRWQLPIHLLDAVFYAAKGHMSVALKQSVRASNILESIRNILEEGYACRALQHNPHCVLLNVDWYHDRLKPAMAEWLYLWFEMQHMSAVGQAELLRYFTDAEIMINQPEIVSKIQSSMSLESRKLANLGRSWLLTFLPHVLQKIDRVHFGLLSKSDYERAVKTDPHMPKTRAKLAVPFVGKDVPSKSSEFAHSDIIIGLTVLAYRYEGLRYSDFDDIVTSLRSTLTKEIGPHRLRKSSLRYEAWVREAGGRIKGDGGSDGVEVIPLYLLKRSNDEQMQRLYSLLQYHPETIQFYLESFIFPAYTDSKVLKLSAAGQELGGEMMFGRRVGFSGTPSDLLPVELGRCEYERGSDGQMLTVMTSPDVCSYEVIKQDWSPASLLSQICSDASSRKYHALIDTGALITGMSNFDVANYLLDHGLDWCDGVVFLDDLDRKMVLVRSTRRVLKMAQCGIPAEKRFAFYDQVHTTGMDIQHTLDATAVLTLSKDMIFRDWAQGAYRMRGINKGQKIHVYVIPEVRDLILRELGALAQSKNLWNMEDETATKKVLVDINAWLVVNAMKSEKVQFHQLCIQNTANVWRKEAYNNLLDRFSECSVDAMFKGELRRCLDVFCEPIDFTLSANALEVESFAASLQRRVDAFKDFVTTDSQRHIITCMQQWASSQQSEQIDEHVLNSEMIQEQEQEREQQQEQEQEQEIEIEKYVELAYSREHEEQTPWPFEDLHQKELPPTFYPANQFKLVKRQPLPFPEYVTVSSNYFDLRWGGARRIKNVIAILEWYDNTHTTVLNQGWEPLSESQEKSVSTALHMFADGNTVNREDLQLILKGAGYTHSNADINTLLNSDDSCIPLAELRHMLLSGQLTPIQLGRKYVAVSLAEAESLRRILHLRAATCGSLQVALRCAAADFIALDTTLSYQDAPTPFMSASAYQSYRFINCDMHFTETMLFQLLRSLHHSTKRERKVFFKNIIACRRRMMKKWTTAPVAKVFSIADHLAMMKQRAQSTKLGLAIKRKGWLLYDAFCKFDFSKTGYLSPAELWGAFEHLDIDMSCDDVIDYFTAADSDKDGNLSYREFLEVLDMGADEEEEEVPALTRQVSLSTVPPKGEQELEVRMMELKAIEEEEDRIDSSYEQEEEVRIAKELEAEEDERDRQQSGGRNPLIDMALGLARYDFSTGRLPRKLKMRGDAAYKTDDVTGQFLKIIGDSRISISNPFTHQGRTDQCTVVMAICWEPTPSAVATVDMARTGSEFEDDMDIATSVTRDVKDYGWMALATDTAKPDEAIVWIDNQGFLHTSTGPIGTNPASRPRLTSQRWHVLSTVMSDTLLTIYLDNSQVAQLSYSGIVGEGIIVGGAKSRQKMCLGCSIRYFAIYSRALMPYEIEELSQTLQREAQATIIAKISDHLQNMGVNPQIANWAATISEGATVDQRLNAALNLVYN